ncbi:MAG: DUF4864 domain-containing protein [Pseudomonadota bacterium]
MRFWLPLVLMIGLAPAVHANDTEPTQVIDAQIAAFQANDLDTAFSFASPTIKRIFGTAERFGRMVQRSYPMVWRPARVRYGQFSDGGVQTVFFTDTTGSVFEARYEMLKTESSWQINGVYVRQAGVGA